MSAKNGALAMAIPKQPYRLKCKNVSKASTPWAMFSSRPQPATTAIK